MMDVVTELRYMVFELAFEYMVASGGDGDATILCRNWKEAADSFELWLDAKHPDFLKRINNEDSVVFQDNQEAIIFADYGHSTPPWADCVIRVSRL